MITKEHNGSIVWTCDLPAAPVRVVRLEATYAGTFATVEPLPGAATDRTERSVQDLYPTQQEAHRRAVTIDRWKSRRWFGARLRPDPRGNSPYEWPAGATMTREELLALAREFGGTAVVMQNAPDASGLVLVVWRSAVGRHKPEDGTPSLPTAWLPEWAFVPEGEEEFFGGTP